MLNNPFLPLAVEEQITEQPVEEEKEFMNTEASTTTTKSKSAKKRLARKRRKQRDNESKSLKDEEEKAPTIESKFKNSEPVAAVADEEEDLDPNQFREKRLEMLKSLKESGVNPYPPKFHVTMTIPAFINLYETLETGEHCEDVVVSLSGRIMQKRMQSSKLMSYVLRGPGGLEVQLMVDARYSDLDVVEFTHLHSGVERGDIVGVTGFPGRCKRGELSLFPRSFVVLSNTLQLLPREKAGPGGDNANVKKNDLWIPGSTRNPESYVLKDQETRYRYRYLDLMLNKEVPQIFRTRARVVDYIRKFLKDLDFLEVETPMINVIAGGATAKPFVTQHSDLNGNLFTRVPPQIYLKQLVVGGLERVFEIGKHFRNHIDLAHNPEFATCEFYEAYADYYDLMDRTEKMLSGMVKELTGGYTVKYHANGFDKDPIEIDFTPPFRRIDVIAELEKMSGLEIPKDLSSDVTNKYLLDACIKFDLKCPPQTTPRLLDTLVEHFLGEKCVNPTFIIDHPEIMSPLARSHRSKLGCTEGFQLFINKQGVCNAYSELNDPVVQRQRFAEQLKDGQFGDDEASALDGAFCTALEFGLPPTAGWGLGIDQLAMLLTDSQNIKEVILFPAMKPKDVPAPQSAHLHRLNNAPVDFVRSLGLILNPRLVFSCMFCMLMIYRFLSI
ncbi:hypothetical protein MKW94_008630 [Papaver nudicaule]|uniref:lysine--tRNA ligase n=1 Tax=Papaver nudicaule TaxID=74823 RepID=A0AA41RU22_PAPNU|nr:hypothetical protein [Papaver nudicaule]